MFKRLLYFIFLFLPFMVSCSSNRQFEEIDDPADVKGPGFLTGNKGEVSLSDFFSEEARQKRARERYSSGIDINMPAIDEQSFEDFENFKAWRRAQDPESPNYQEYQDWRAYQQYLRFKQQQGEPQPAKP